MAEQLTSWPGRPEPAAASPNRAPTANGTPVSRPREPPSPAHAVRRARLATGVSLRELARRVGVSPATLHAIETGKTDLGVRRLREIAAALRVSPARLLETEPDPLSPAMNRQPAARDLSAVSAPPTGPGRTGDCPPTSPGRVGGWRQFDPLPLDPVLAAAIAEFVRTGYHGASMRSIAERAGMSVPGVYHHYASKQELLVTTLDLAMDDLTWRLLAARAEGEDPVARVRLLVEALALFHAHRGQLAFIGASEMRGLDPANRRRIADLRAGTQHLLDAAIDEAVAAGMLTTPTPRLAGRAIATMCTSLPQWFRLGGPVTPERIAAEYAHFALGLLGYRTPRGSGRQKACKPSRGTAG